ncbi:MAG: arsenosugar biosynthesis radical SAM protein ArsS [Pseudomonadales bacterium]|nr:arsenosugar biosynthesis radical SAM protein ArsS [Pseudomonadales bacterium]
MQDTRPLLLDSDFPPIRRGQLDTLQVNLGYLCNLSCTHCHVNAGPDRTELMDHETVEQVLEFLQRHKIGLLDLTGGSPEMNPQFRYLVTEARKLDVVVMDRCNPTILEEPGYEYLPEFFVQNQVVVVASLPCYMEQNVDKQRGKGVYQESVAGLKKLNAVGYGNDSGELMLNLVFNPDDAVLPPEQQSLQAEYRQSLGETHGIIFNELFVLANMPIQRFGARLLAKGQYVDYMQLLRGAFVAENLDTVMCRNLISVDYQGFVYDCDFNQMLAMPIIEPNRSAVNEPIVTDVTKKMPVHLKQLLDQSLTDNPIITGEHCYACTAGQGSSCGGALS